MSENGEIPDDASLENGYADAEASVDEPGSRAEFATRRAAAAAVDPAKQAPLLTATLPVPIPAPRKHLKIATNRRLNL